MRVEHRDRGGDASGNRRTSASTNTSTSSSRPRRARPRRAGVRLAQPAGRAAGRRHAAGPGGRATARTTSAVPSVEPSSTTTTRRSVDPRWSSSRGQAVGHVRLLVAHGQDHGDRAAHRRRVGGRTAEQGEVDEPRAPRPATEIPASARTSRPLTGGPRRPPVLRRARTTSTGTASPAPHAAEPGSPSQPTCASAPPRVIQAEREQRRGVADPRRARYRTSRRTSRSSRDMSTSAGQQPAGQVGQRHGVDARAAPGCGCAHVQ